MYFKWFAAIAVKFLTHLFTKLLCVGHLAPSGREGWLPSAFWKNRGCFIVKLLNL